MYRYISNLSSYYQNKTIKKSSFLRAQLGMPAICGQANNTESIETSVSLCDSNLLASKPYAIILY